MITSRVVGTNIEKFKNIKWGCWKAFEFKRFIEHYIYSKMVHTNHLAVPVAFNDKEFYLFDFSKCTAISIGGLTGFGKTNLLRHMVLSSIILFKKDDYEIYCLDETKSDMAVFGQVVNYAKKNVLSIFQKLEKQLKNRIDAFDKMDVVDIAEYNKIIKPNKMKYIFIYSDEYMECQKSIKILKWLIKTGRAYGYRFVFTAHSMHNEFIDPMVRRQFEIRCTFYSNDDTVMQVNVGHGVYKKFKERYSEGVLKKGTMLMSSGDWVRVAKVPFLPYQLTKQALKYL